MYVGFLIVSPMDSGPSLSRYVKKAIDAVHGTGIAYQVTAMGTILEAATLDEMFRAAEAAVEAVKAEGSQRISLSLKVDIRFDRDISMDSKMRSVGRS
ncbi:MAG: MTH1187 family thiamine-binding protein [Candidatus Thermoplasmatota archaeon]|nr:MTH1187 family thiamine-binding protein [Candidatus Thermoplasmatota archaeon]